MAKSTKKSEIERAYAKERRRIKRRISDYESKGLLVNLVVPKIPKRITEASVRRLRKIDIKAIRKNAIWFDSESGEILGNYADFQKAKKESRSINRAAVEQFEEMVSSVAFHAGSRGKNYAIRAREILKQLESELGYQDYARMITRAVKNGTALTPEELYESEEAIIAGYERMLKHVKLPDLEIDLFSSF